MYQIVYTKFEIMVVISTREFRQNLKKYLDLIDKNERVIIQRGKDKVYEISKDVKNDRFFDDPAVQERLVKSIQSYSEGKTVKLSDDQLKDLLGI
ncbi:Antitoxin Phd_YefM, type II toxin-antitoxin system [Algoriphagus hitonicola]|uniref:Antitoxin Phd_YefM, type II toxin-antitoxin system n=2 Tax=Algoriphagus hitonicola TaxID=435880 RepID=A0A1I2P1H1_9BACT|nr:Antitoxin Phd_YefM, type II toxin-antitoxin system [Algoriphagus hitonicola]